MVAIKNSSENSAPIGRGAKGLISHFTNQQIASKLMAMGILPGSHIEYIRKAPFGGGCYVKVDNLLIALRPKEAGSIVLR